MTEREKFLPGGAGETIKKIITLDDIIDASRPIPQEYRILQQQNPELSAATDTSPFSRFWGLRLDFGTKHEDGSDREKAQRFFKERLKQRVLIDLGGGRVSFRDKKNLRASPVAELAKNCGAVTYINVDTGHPNSVFENDIEGIHVIEVGEDMLSFVARMKDDSACFTLNGIHLRSGADGRYFEALEKEIVRATCQGGIIFSFESDVSFYQFSGNEKSPLRLIPIILSSDSRIFVFEKLDKF